MPVRLHVSEAEHHQLMRELTPRGWVTHRLDDLADCVEHKLRLLLVDLVAAVRAGDVLRVRHERGESLLRLFLCGIGDIAEVRRDIGCQFACRYH